jgi:ATP-dependent Clp protease adaptor protein ClpS
VWRGLTLGPQGRANNEKKVGHIIMLRLAQETLTRLEQVPVSAAGGSQPPGGDDGGRSNTSIITKAKPRTKRPNLYRVLLLNDDYTPMEFVVHVLERFFNKNREDATRIMLHVHQNGVGECGVFTYEVAETKVTQVMDFARKHQHPLQCVMEKN